MPEVNPKIWFVTTDEGRYGPCNREDVGRLLAAGRITGDDICWQQGQLEGVVVRSLLGLAFEAPPSATQIAKPVSSSLEPPVPGSRPAAAPVLRTEPRPAMRSTKPSAVSLDQGLERKLAALENFEEPVLTNRKGKGDPRIKIIRGIFLAIVLLGGAFVMYLMVRAPLLQEKNNKRHRPPVVQTTIPPASQPVPSASERRQELEAILEDARSQASRGDFAEARELCNDVIDACAYDTDLSDVTEAARGIIQWVELSENPEARFELRGASVGTNTIVKVYDRRDNVELSAKVGDSLAEFHLDSYDPATKQAQISLGRNKFFVGRNP